VGVWVESLGAKVMRNTSGKSYRALSEDKTTWSNERWIAEFSQDVMLLKRPILIKNGRAIAAGFKPTVLQELIRSML
jgi:arsenate reductase